MPLFDALLFGSPVRPRFGAILSAVLGRRISGTACRASNTHGTQCCIFGARNGAGDGAGFDTISGPG
jgi:hypothetical protein